MSILEELNWRGLVADCTDKPELTKRSITPLTLYAGFDPTADSLHVGNLVPLLGLRRFQLLGHHPIALAGGATGSIGDPSGKTQERQLLTKEILDRNIARVRLQLTKLLDFDDQQNPARLADNASWTAGVSYLDFLRDIGKHFSVNQMVAKESVRARMEDREVGISYTEFSYMLLQAFDFYVLCRDYNCELQIGGSDQWGNITAGIDLTRKKLSRTVYGLTLPLITNADGTKFGKTEAGAIWLDPKRTSVYRFYQFWINTDDRDVIRYLKFFTFLSREEITALEEKHAVNPGGREAHRVLAKVVTDLIHGESATQEAIRASEILFGGNLDGISETTFNEIVGEVPTKEVEHIDLDDASVPLVELLVHSGLSPSKGQARKDIEGGGVNINNVREVSSTRAVTTSDLLFGKHLLLRKGKKNYVVVEALAQAFKRARAKAEEINCVNNLKQIGLAFRTWAIAHGDEFPFNVPAKYGGSLESCASGDGGFDLNSWRHFQTIVQELITPKILVCPTDPSKTPAVDFNNFGSTNVTYQIRSGPNIKDINPQEVLGRCPIHNTEVLCDGSVHSRSK